MKKVTINLDEMNANLVLTITDKSVRISKNNKAKKVFSRNYGHDLSLIKELKKLGLENGSTELSTSEFFKLIENVPTLTEITLKKVMGNEFLETCTVTVAESDFILKKDKKKKKKFKDIDFNEKKTLDMSKKARRFYCANIKSTLSKEQQELHCFIEKENSEFKNLSISTSPIVAQEAGNSGISDDDLEGLY